MLTSLSPLFFVDYAFQLNTWHNIEYHVIEASINQLREQWHAQIKS